MHTSRRVLKIMKVHSSFVLLVVVFSTILITVKGDKTKESSDVETTTKESELISSLNRITSKVQSIKDRIAKSKNSTADTLHTISLEEGYEYAPKLGYYKLYQIKLSWHEALRYCEKMRSQFAIITSSEEKNASFFKQ